MSFQDLCLVGVIPVASLLCNEFVCKKNEAEKIRGGCELDITAKMAVLWVVET